MGCSQDHREPRSLPPVRKRLPCAAHHTGSRRRAAPADGVPLMMDEAAAEAEAEEESAGELGRIAKSVSELDLRAAALDERAL